MHKFSPAEPLIALNTHEAATLDAVFERMFPADTHGPGASTIGVIIYLDRALSGAYTSDLGTYRLGVAALDRAAQERFGVMFSAANSSQQDELVTELERNNIDSAPLAFFELLRKHLQEGLFSDPVYGGNRNKAGWRLLSHPGVWLENSAEENLQETPADKGGVIQSLADLGSSMGGGMGVLAHGHGQDARDTEIMGKDAHATLSMGKDAHATLSMGKDAHTTLSMGKDAHATLSMGKDAHTTLPMGKDANATFPMPMPRDPHRGAADPVPEADIVLVGCGSMGSLVAPLFAKAGLKVLAFEPGPYRTGRDYLPDELRASYYCRASMGPKFLSEIPRWRRNTGEPTCEATFSLGRMMNSVGGSIIHYGAWLRRFHAHHFRLRSHIEERWGRSVLPAGCALADWCVSYDELESYYTLLEQAIGIAGDETNPFVRRSRPLPMPPMRPFRLGEFFRQATEAMGLHPHPVPVGVNTAPYGGRPATTYSAWSNGFGSPTGDKWDPSLTCVPEALATGNLDLRTHCRVIRLLTDETGRVSGVEYIDALGRRREQRARTAILCAYTFENLRLMFLSGSARHPHGLGNDRRQLGRYFMTKMFAHVDGYFPDVCFNRHTGPAAQGLVLDDFLSPNFDSVRHGFIGGATFGAEQQFLPIQISREALPPNVQRWGKPYKDHLRNWQHLGVVRIQPDTLSYDSNFIDLDPDYRDKSGLGLPLIRITYDMRENEHRLADWMESKAEEILRAMGATKTWRGDRFTGVGSSHDFGGARMGDDPARSVVDPELRVHDTPGLYVFSGATFPTCPGINPTLTLAALCYRAAERLVTRLNQGAEP